MAKKVFEKTKIVDAFLKMEGKVKQENKIQIGKDNFIVSILPVPKKFLPLCKNELKQISKLNKELDRLENFEFVLPFYHDIVLHAYVCYTWNEDSTMKNPKIGIAVVDANLEIKTPCNKTKDYKIAELIVDIFSNDSYELLIEYAEKIFKTCKDTVEYKKKVISIFGEIVKLANELGFKTKDEISNFYNEYFT